MKTKRTKEVVQLELPLGGLALQGSSGSQRVRTVRARWWFRAMHCVIGAALNCNPHAGAGAEQGRLNLTSAGAG
ncbi:MAG: hypothetical protein N3G20_04870, partial [Verrucomicrobiae bacterium]|nr:hypothetical protein [Verrucomicrobiae bacterium]